MLFPRSSKFPRHPSLMSHPEQIGFLQSVASCNEEVVRGGRVLEIGSYDVNGSTRSIFELSATYTGVDLTEGPGVDRIGFGHEVNDPDGSYDVVISAECFEHDPHWRKTLANMARLTAPGGVLAFSCASRGRPEHGTRRTSALLSPGTQSEGLDYYRNVTTDDLVSVPFDEWFTAWRAWYLPTNFDLYFCGVRRGGHGARVPSADAIDPLRGLMPWPHRLARLPLRTLAATRLNEEELSEPGLSILGLASTTGWRARYPLEALRAFEGIIRGCRSESQSVTRPWCLGARSESRAEKSGQLL